MSGLPLMLENFLLRKWDYAGEVCLVALVFTGCLKTRKADPNKQQHPLHNFAATFLGTFATGVLGPLFVGEVPLPLMNDAIFTTLIVIWFLFYRFDKAMVKFSTTFGVYQVLVFFSTLSRANNVCVFTDKAYKRILKHFPPQFLHYPLPLLGPIIVGVIRGSGGNFFPPEKGLSALKTGLPFNSQIALVASALWHLAVNDTYVMGGAVRGALSLLTLGAGPPSPTALKCAIVVFFLVMNILQTFPKYSTANPFWPAWEVVYYTTGVERSPGTAPPPVPKMFKGLYHIDLRRQKELFIEMSRYAFVAAMAVLAVWRQLPADTLHAGQVLRQGDYLGTCTFVPQLRKCTPTVAVVEPEGRIAVYKGKSPKDKAKQLLWASGKKSQKASSAEGWVAIMREDGTLALQDGASAKKAAWTSRIGGDAKKARAVMARAVLGDGALNAYRAGVQAWSTKG